MDYLGIKSCKEVDDMLGRRQIRRNRIREANRAVKLATRNLEYIEKQVEQALKTCRDALQYLHALKNDEKEPNT